MSALAFPVRQSASIVPAVASACLALATPAASAVMPVSGRSIDATPVALTFDAAGRAVASWRGLTGANPNAARTFHAIALTRRDGTWRTPMMLPATVVAHDLAVTGGRTAALAAWREQPLRGSRSRSVISVTLIDTVSSTVRHVIRLATGPPRPVTYEGPQPTLLSPRVAATPRGGLVVAWLRSDSRATAGVWAATISPNGRAARARRLGPNGGDPVLALAPDGRGLLAWRRGHRIQARLRTPNGAWGRIETAAVGDRRQWAQVEYLSASAANGYVLGVLETQRTGAGVWIRSSVHVRVRGAGWRSATLGELTFVPTGATSYVTDHLRVLTFATSDGRLHAAWPALIDGHVRAMTATLVPQAATVEISSPLALSPPGTDVALEDAAAGPNGTYAVTWFDTSNGSGTPGLAEIDATSNVRRTPGIASERSLFGAQLAYGPVTDLPMVIWSEGGYPQGYRIVAWTSPAPKP